MTDPRQRARDAFDRADEGLEPAMERLMAGVPDAMGEARRRRGAVDRGLLPTLLPLAWKAIPRLGALAALLLAVSAVLYITEEEPVVAAQSEHSNDFEQLILTGSATSDDPLLRAISGSEGDG